MEAFNSLEIMIQNHLAIFFEVVDEQVHFDNGNQPVIQTSMDEEDIFHKLLHINHD